MMPMAELFAPDVNYVAARNIYPSSRGGTVAQAGGGLSAVSSGVGAVQEDGTAAGTTISPRGHPLLWWGGILALLVAMVVIARKTGSAEDFRNLRPTAYNFLTITLTAIVGIVGLKTIFTKYNLPGISDVIRAV